MATVAASALQRCDSLACRVGFTNSEAKICVGRALVGNRLLSPMVHRFDPRCCFFVVNERPDKTMASKLVCVVVAAINQVPSFLGTGHSVNELNTRG